MMKEIFYPLPEKPKRAAATKKITYIDSDGDMDDT